MQKRKRKKVKRYWLFDNSILLTLNPEQRAELDSKRNILYPPILLIENAHHGLDRRRALFNFQNTINVLHWSERAKMDLLAKTSSYRYGIGVKLSTKSIYEESEAERQKMERQASEVVRMMDKEVYDLKNCPSILKRDGGLFKLCENFEKIPDKELLRKFNQANRKSSKFDGRPYYPIPRGIGNEKIPQIRKFLKEYREACKIDTLTKADEWVGRLFFCTGDPFQFVIDFLDNGRIISVTGDERTQIIDRYISEGKPHMNIFAPYAVSIIRLYLTIFLYLVENLQNSYSQEVSRDFDYLYYALDANVTFVSADKKHKEFLEEIPLLKNVRKRFIFIDKKNKEKIKKGLKLIGIKG